MKRASIEALVGKPVRICWEDATGLSSGWQTRDELINAELPLVTTIAHLVHVSRRALHVAGDVLGDECAGTGLIPIAWVQSAEALVVAPAVRVTLEEQIIAFVPE